MKLNLEVTVNSGMSYLLSFAAVVGYAFYQKPTLSELWIPIAALYGWHSGRRLWRELKLPNGTQIIAPDGETGNGGGVK